MSTPPAQPQTIAVNNNQGVVAGVVNEFHLHAAPEKHTLDSEVTRYYQNLARACDVVTAQLHYPSVKTPSTQSKVEDVYVEPDVWVRSLETEGADGMATEKRAVRAFERQPWKSCFNSDEQRFQRIALLADGGMGKTTAVDREIQLLCDGQRPWLALRLPSLLRVDGGVSLDELVEQALTLDIAARLNLDRAAAEKIGHSLLNHLDRQAGVLLFDGFDVVPYVKDSRYGYAMSQGGNVAFYDRKTGQNRFIQPNHPDPKAVLRYNWNAGIAQDPFNDCGVYFGSQYLHYSDDCGENWVIISPDLTTNDTTKQKASSVSDALNNLKFMTSYSYKFKEKHLLIDLSFSSG